MNVVVRVIGVAAVVLGCLFSTGAAAQADPGVTGAASSASSVASSGPLGSDSKESVIAAAVAGLALGAAIAFWQSRRHRGRERFRDERQPPDGNDESSRPQDRPDHDDDSGYP